MNEIIKYPRTQHIEGSGFQKGDIKEYYPFKELIGKYIVLEEKLDGSNVGISFDSDKTLYLQSRGHYLVGHPREFHFSYFKQWANERKYLLWEILKDRYILYAEYMFAAHCIFYNSLTSYINEFDIFDKQNEYFLSTKARFELLNDFRQYNIVSVPVLFEGIMENIPLESFITRSKYCNNNIAADLKHAYVESNNNKPFEEISKGIDVSGTMEGLYIKEEDDHSVLNRYKYIRAGFLQAVIDNNGHWMDRNIIKNKLIWI